MKTIFLILQNKTKKDKIINLSKSLDITLKFLTVSDLGKTINQISGFNLPSKTSQVKIPPMYVCPEVLIFSGFTSKELDIFLDEYKKAAIEPIGLKAVVTMYNASWTLFDLIEELKKERASMDI